jgi:hypothetical protein
MNRIRRPFADSSMSVTSRRCLVASCFALMIQNVTSCQWPRRLRFDEAGAALMGSFYRLRPPWTAPPEAHGQFV